LYDGKLDDQEFEKSLEDIFKKETRDLFVKYYGSSQMENEQLGIHDVRLQITDQLLQGNFIHNDALLLEGNPPYREVEYLQIQDRFKSLNNNLQPEDVEKLNQEVKDAQTLSLLKFLQT